jgi:hypothetical protein
VSDPLTFWHPGDSDPAPTTIDNSVPDAPNSAAISFEWADLPVAPGSPPDMVLLRDSTADNNGGLFVNMVTLDLVVETDPALATPTPTAAELASAHLRRFYRAMYSYTLDNYDYFPDDLLRLWEQGRLAAPRTFWNPGDSDPMPMDITNSVPDAINSTQISFEYLVGGLTVDQLAIDSVLMRDNSPSNNGGDYIHLLYNDHSVETDPPQAIPTVSAMLLGLKHITRFRYALRTYAWDNGGYYPDDLKDLWDEGYLVSPGSFWHPGDSDPPPTDITNSTPDALNSAQISFEYLGAGLNESVPPETVLLRDNSRANNGNLGRWVLTAGYYVDFSWEVDRGDGNGDGRIDLADWELMELCLNGPLDAPRTLDVYYYVFDFNFDDMVDLEDVAAFMAAFTGPVE